MTDVYDATNNAVYSAVYAVKRGLYNETSIADYTDARYVMPHTFTAMATESSAARALELIVKELMMMGVRHEPE